MTPEWQHVLFHSFNKAVLPTAFVETLLARLNQWLQRSHTPRSMSLRQGKHTTSGLACACTKKRGVASGGLEPCTKRRKLGRPAWVFKEGERARLNARHVAVSEHIAQRAVGAPQADALRHARATWGELSPRAKARARAVAREKKRARPSDEERQH